MMSEVTPLMVASGALALWTVMWVAFSYSERGSDRPTIRMGAWLATAAIGLWLILSIAVLAVGYLLVIVLS